MTLNGCGPNSASNLGELPGLALFSTPCWLLASGPTLSLQRILTCAGRTAGRSSRATLHPLTFTHLFAPAREGPQIQTEHGLRPRRSPPVALSAQRVRIQVNGWSHVPLGPVEVQRQTDGLR